jgi:hypothetical protein
MTNGHSVKGPAIIIENNRYYNYIILIDVLLNFILHSTIVVEPGCLATVTEYGDIKIMVCQYRNALLY